MAELKSAHIDLAEDDFPFTVRYLSEATGDVVAEIEVTEPGVMMAPGQDTLKEPCHVELVDKDGKTVYRSWS